MSSTPSLMQLQLQLASGTSALTPESLAAIQKLPGVVSVNAAGVDSADGSTTYAIRLDGKVADVASTTRRIAKAAPGHKVVWNGQGPN